MMAMRLEIQALAGSVGGDKDAHRMLVRRQVEGTFDRVALFRRRRSVEDLDALLVEVGASERGAELVDQIALGIVVLSEDEQAQVRPFDAALRASIARQSS